MLNEPESETLLNSSASNHALLPPRALQVSTRKNSVNRRITQLTTHVIQDHSVNSKMSCTGKTWSFYLMSIQTCKPLSKLINKSSFIYQMNKLSHKTYNYVHARVQRRKNTVRTQPLSFFTIKFCYVDKIKNFLTDKSFFFLVTLGPKISDTKLRSKGSPSWRYS